MKENIMPFIHLLNEMSPYLLLGYLIAGILHAFVPQRLYHKHFSGNDFKSVLRAALFGIPLPLCSCGVIPTAMSLRKNGASKGATVSFLISTPQTGADSILATWSLLGAPFAVLRPFIAFVTALFGGTLVNRFANNGTESAAVASCTEESENLTFGQRCAKALRYGFVDMMRSIGKWLVTGLLIAGLIAIFVPDDFFTAFAEYPLLNMLVVLILAIPMYLCATGSIPIAAALMLKGLSPGTALVLLMAGPATSMASILVLGKTLDRKTMWLYLASIIAGAMGFGLLIDYCLPADWFTTGLSAHAGCCMHGAELSWWKTLSSVIFIILLCSAFITKHKENHVTMEGEVYRIKGMTCNHCKANVENNLAKIEGVESVSVDLSKGIAYVKGSADRLKIIDTIESLGYHFEEQ